MKIKGLTLITSLLSAVYAKVITPSGAEVPKSLLNYLNCPIGDVICKNGQGRTCTAQSNVCKYGNPAILGELLSNNGHDIGNLTPAEYCKIHLEVCDMVMTYEPPLTKDYIYNLDQYLTCGKDDSICQYGRSTSCQAVLKLCWGNYPKEACKNLSDTCSKIYGEEKENANTTTTKKTTTTTNRKTTTTKKTTKKSTTKKTTKKIDTRRKTTTKKSTKKTTKKTTTKKTTKKTTTKKVVTTKRN